MAGNSTDNHKMCDCCTCFRAKCMNSKIEWAILKFDQFWLCKVENKEVCMNINIYYYIFSKWVILDENTVEYIEYNNK